MTRCRPGCDLLLAATLAVSAFVYPAPAPASAPPLAPPLRAFILGPDLDPSSGRELLPGDPVVPEPGRWLCAEAPSGEVLLYAPPAQDAASYVRASLTDAGSAARAIAPEARPEGADAFLSLPSAPGLICRRMSAGEPGPLQVGVAYAPVAEYAWEDYEDRLTRWAARAARTPERPPDPPVAGPVSLADRLWFLSVLVQASGRVAPADEPAVRDALEEAALWEVVRLRPLDGWAFGVRSLSSAAGDDCFRLDPADVEPVCRSDRRPVPVRVEGPAVLSVVVRPELREAPTPVIEPVALRIVRDGQVLLDDAEPVYPDRDPALPEVWSPAARPLRDGAGRLLARPRTVRVLVPPGTHELTLDVPGRPAWWKVTAAWHRRHIQDAALGRERLGGRIRTRDPALGTLLQAARDLRLGRCSEALRGLSAVESAAGVGAAFEPLARAALAACRPFGETWTPGDLVRSLARAGQAVSGDTPGWEDRPAAERVAAQAEAARFAFVPEVPGARLDGAARALPRGRAPADALRDAWYLESVWQELAPPPTRPDDGVAVFQDRRARPADEALPGGLALLRLGAEVRKSLSRLLPGLPRSVTFVTAGRVDSGPTVVEIQGTRVRLEDAAAVQVHRLLAGQDPAVRLAAEGPRDAYVQTATTLDDEVADAKLVSAWPVAPGTPLSLVLPSAGYRGTALLQVFPPPGAASREATFRVRGTGCDVRMRVRTAADDPGLAIADTLDRRTGRPVSLPFALDVPTATVTVEPESLDGDGWLARVLIRVPRRPVAAPDRPLRLSTDAAAALEEVRAATRALDETPPGDARARLWLRRSDALCRLGWSAFAREDLLRAASLSPLPPGLEAPLVAARDALDAGACRPDPWPAGRPPVALDARTFVEDATGTPDEPPADRCEAAAVQDPRGVACVAGWAHATSREIAAGRPAPADFLRMYPLAGAVAQATRWPGLDLPLQLLTDRTRWVAVDGVESNDGTVEAWGSEESAWPADAYESVVRALVSPRTGDDRPGVLAPGYTEAVRLPLVASNVAVARLDCRLLTPSLSLRPQGCTATLALDGREVRTEAIAPDGTAEVRVPIPSGGSHLLEVRHAATGRLESPVLRLSLALERPAGAAVPTREAGGLHVLLDRHSGTFFRASSSRPVALHLLGPTVLRVDARTPELAAAAARVDVDGPGGAASVVRVERPGRTDLWLLGKGAYAVAVRPASGAPPVLVSLRYREAVEPPSPSPAAAAEDDAPPAAAPPAPPLPVLAVAPPATEGLPVPLSAAGTVHLLAGGQSGRADEGTNGIDPDDYLFQEAGYARRIEGANVWLGFSGQARERMTGDPSFTLSGVAYWQDRAGDLRVRLSDHAAFQDVETGVAGSNRLTGQVAWRFLPHPDLSIVPEAGAFWVFQGLDRWPEGRVRPGVDYDVYNAFSRDHPWGAWVGALVAWDAWVNDRPYLRLRVFSNADQARPDRVQVRIGDRVAFGRFQASLLYDLEARLADADRASTYLNHRIELGGDGSIWFGPDWRLALGVTWGFLPATLDHTLIGGLRIEWSGSRGLRDAIPGDEPFPWQVDPHRRYVEHPGVP